MHLGAFFFHNWVLTRVTRVSRQQRRVSTLETLVLTPRLMKSRGLRSHMNESDQSNTVRPPIGTASGNQNQALDVYKA